MAGPGGKTTTQRSPGEIRAQLDRAAEKMIQASRAGKADEIMAQSLAMVKQFPTHIGLLQGMVELLTAAGDLPGATRHAETIVNLMPKQAMAHLALASCLQRQFQTAPAIKALRRAEGLAQNEVQALSLIAQQYEKADAIEDSLRTLLRALQLEPDSTNFCLRIAANYRFLGKLTEAEAYCDRTIAANPKDWHCYYLRSDLRKQSKENNHIKQLESVLAQGISDPDGRARVLYALAKEYEDIDDADNSFRCLTAASAIQRKDMDYDVKNDLKTMEEIKVHFGRDYFRNLRPGHPAADPIFIIGMPRTGTTLVERIVGSHSKVRSLGELVLFPRLMVRSAKEKTGSREVPPSERVKLTSQLDYKQLGERYIQMSADRRTGKAFFIDKLPYNYLNIGPIHAALPNAKIIQVDRHPMDTCYAIYKMLFGRAYPFSYTQEELALYYAGYRKLMDHWHAVLPPGRILKVRYEDMVEDQEGQTRRIFEHCGLGWEAQVLDFHKNVGSSTTASAAQVRSPIYKTSVAKWRRYERHLEPLRSILRNEGITGLD